MKSHIFTQNNGLRRQENDAHRHFSYLSSAYIMSIPKFRATEQREWHRKKPQPVNRTSYFLSGKDVSHRCSMFSFSYRLFFVLRVCYISLEKQFTRKLFWTVPFAWFKSHNKNDTVSFRFFLLKTRFWL